MPRPNPVRAARATALLLAIAAAAGACRTSPALPPPTPAGELRSFSRSGMGVRLEIAVVAPPDSDADAAVERAFACFDRVELLTSSWSGDSQVARWNRDHDLPVDAELAALVRRALELSAATGRAFDPTIGGPLRDLGFYGAEPATEPRERPVGPSLVRVAVQGERASVRAPDGLELDLSALAKGHAADLALEELARAGLGNARVDAGASTIAARGPGPPEAAGRGWPATLPHPDGDRTLWLRDESLSTSGQTSITLPGGDSHVLDPRTLEPVDHRTEACAVRTRSALLGDVLATALLVVGADGARAWLDERPDLARGVDVVLWSVGASPGEPEVLELPRAGH